LPRQLFGDQRSGNTTADDQRVALQVLAYIGSGALPGMRKPRRTAAAQIGLLGVVGFKGINGDSVAWNWSISGAFSLTVIEL
jgi:hypothetical protein